MAIDGLDQGYSMTEVSKKYKILRSSLRDQYEGKIKGRKMGLKIVLTKVGESKSVEYIELMVH